MARTNIEENAWPRLEKLAKMLAADPEKVIGKMATLWHESQDALAVLCSREQLLIWCNLYSETDAEQNRWLKAMCAMHFVEQTINGKGDEAYHLVGNQRHVDAHQQRLHASKAGGAAKRLRASGKPDGSRAEAGPEAGNQVSASRMQAQFNSIQFNSKQFNTSKTEEEEIQGDLQIDDAPPTPKPKPARRKTAEPPVEGVNLVIGHYCETWKARYKATPPIDQKTAGQIKRLVKEFGRERVEKMLSAYLQMGDRWFITKRHDIATMCQNMNAVAQFAATGKIITSHDVKNLEANQYHQNLRDRIDKGEL